MQEEENCKVHWSPESGKFLQPWNKIPILYKSMPWTIEMNFWKLKMWEQEKKPTVNDLQDKEVSQKVEGQRSEAGSIRK